MVDPGFCGKITLELSPRLPIRLEEGMVIGKLTIARLRKPADQPYDGRYQHAAGPELAKL
jgi:deoxycytidine triphosphate deaminase